MGISEIVIKKDVSNILKKLERGKTLTASERATIREFERANERAESPKFPKPTAKTVVELAQTLGVSRRILSTWRKKYDDAPKPRANGLHDISKWLEFIRKHNLQTQSAVNTDEDSTENEILRARKLKAEVELAEHKVAIAKCEYVSIETVKEVWGAHIAQTRKTLESRLLNELPPTLAAMEEAVAIRQCLQDVIDECCAAMAEASGQLETPIEEEE